MKCLIHRMLVSTAIALVSLSCAGQAMAASPHHKASPHRRVTASAVAAPYRYQSPLDVAAIPPYPDYSSSAGPAPRTRAGTDIAARPAYPRWGYGPQPGYGPQWGYGFAFGAPGIDVRGLIASVLGGLPLRTGGRVAVSSSGSSDFDDTPPADTSAADAAGWAAEQAANDAAAAASAQTAADTQALDQSIAAAEAQNDAANAATQQYLINNGM